MSKSEEKARTSWNCVKCNSLHQVRVGARYYNCVTCGTMFRLHWRGEQIDGQMMLENIPSVAVPESSDLLSELNVEENRVELQNLNEQIRRLEMSKGGEKIRILAIFLMICSAIYALFRITVQGFEVLMNPGTVELVAAGTASISLLVLAVFRLRKAAMVRKVNRLLKQRNIIEQELERVEAVIETRSDSLKQESEESKVKTSPAPEKEKEPEKNAQTDIIEKFASRRKQARKRLNIRDDES